MGLFSARRRDRVIAVNQPSYSRHFIAHSPHVALYGPTRTLRPRTTTPPLIDEHPRSDRQDRPTARFAVLRSRWLWRRLSVSVHDGRGRPRGPSVVFAFTLLSLTLIRPFILKYIYRSP
ncbi:hypothetical protein OG21DRAFT_1513411 [Imleria badia]|nr:hypothetical protein OG21DRAFT_1513411 [Imleria badia]